MSDKHMQSRGFPLVRSIAPNNRTTDKYDALRKMRDSTVTEGPANACYTCYLNREACDEGSPICHRCEHMGRRCESKRFPIRHSREPKTEGRKRNRGPSFNSNRGVSSPSRTTIEQDPVTPREAVIDSDNLGPLIPTNLLGNIFATDAIIQPGIPNVAPDNTEISSEFTLTPADIGLIRALHESNYGTIESRMCSEANPSRGKARNAGTEITDLELENNYLPGNQNVALNNTDVVAGMVLTTDELNFLNNSVCGAVSRGAELHALSEANTINMEGGDEAFPPFDYLQLSGYNSEECEGFVFENFDDAAGSFGTDVFGAGFGVQQQYMAESPWNTVTYKE